MKFIENLEKNTMNAQQVISQLYFGKTLSCSELSERIDKSLPVTAKILGELINEGYVIESGFAESTGGRRPLKYSLKPDIMYTVSVAMDQFVTSIAILNMHNENVTEIKRCELPLANNDKALETLAKEIDEYINASLIPKEKIAGIGIGMPGFVDAVKGVNYSHLQTKNASINTYINRLTNLPVFIDNDSSVIALAELKFGSAGNSGNAMVINIGWGIGLGLVLNGKLFRGFNGFAGEFSHIPLFTNGKLCTCGKRGCLETESSLQTVAEKAKEGLQKGRLSMLSRLQNENLEQTTEIIIQSAGSGDQFAVELLSEAGYNIGRGVAILIHLLNPEKVILSGRGSLAGRIWQAPIQQALNEHCIPRLSASTEIVISSLGYQAEIIGAAALVMENFEKKFNTGPMAELVR